MAQAVGRSASARSTRAVAVTRSAYVTHCSWRASSLSRSPVGHLGLGRTQQCGTWCARAPPVRAPALSTAAAAEEAAEESEDLMELEIKVQGMMCDGCTSRVTEALQKVPDVLSVQVSLESGLATCEVKAASPIEAFNMLPGLVGAVRELGFEAEPHIDGL